MENEALISKKGFVILFIVLAVIAVGVASYSNFSKLGSQNASPSPTEADLFGGSQTGSSNQKPNPQQALQPNAQQNAQQTMQKKQYSSFPGELSQTDLTNKKAVIETNKGIIEFEIFPDAPKAASNFIFLTKEGFYDNLTFHRVVPGFVIQGGDPLGTGSGGPGYKFADEPVTKKYTKGIVAMANAGPNTNGSQFFIMLEDNPDLPPNYTIFGNVLTGQDVVDKIQVRDVMKKVSILPL